MSNRLTGTHRCEWYSEFSRTNQIPQELNSNTITINTITTTQSASESYQGEMVFLNNGLRSNLIMIYTT